MHYICEKTLLTPWKISEVFPTRWYEKKTDKEFLFLTGRVAFFQKQLFSTTFQVLQKRSYNFHKTCHNTSATRVKCSLMFFILDNNWKYKPNSILTVEIHFFEKFVPNDHLGPEKNKIIACRLFVNYLLDAQKMFFDACHAR